MDGGNRGSSWGRLEIPGLSILLMPPYIESIGMGRRTRGRVSLPRMVGLPLVNSMEKLFVMCLKSYGALGSCETLKDPPELMINDLQHVQSVLGDPNERCCHSN